MRPKSVTHRDVFYFITDDPGNKPITVTMYWSPRTPFEVAIKFHETKKRPEWFIGRQLLTDGLTGEAGGGDITIRPARDNSWVELHLSSPTGHAGLLMYRHAITKFLNATYAQTPADRELTPLTDKQLQRLTTY